MAICYLKFFSDEERKKTCTLLRKIKTEIDHKLIDEMEKDDIKKIRYIVSSEKYPKFLNVFLNCAKENTKYILPVGGCLKGRRLRLFIS